MLQKNKLPFDILTAARQHKVQFRRKWWVQPSVYTLHHLSQITALKSVILGKFTQM